MSKPIVQFKNVGEKFKLYRQRDNSLKNRIFDFIKETSISKEEFWALSNINFDIKKGEIVGIVGENGSGKTTILNLIAGILKPDAGDIEVKGKVSALLELGTGFHPELSGRENIYLYGAVLGLSKKIIDSKFEEIVRFAELEKFIDAPVKTYSAGMYVRLGFAVAINVDPDILLIDEVLAVGDEAFQQKCIKKIYEFKQKGKTIVFISHNMHLVKTLCNRVIVLKEGRMVVDTDANESIELYQEILGEKKGIAVLQRGSLKLIFNNGKIILLWDNKMLSKGLGGYTSLLSYGIWHESASAAWECKEVTPSKIITVGRWLYLPITQVWQIELKEENIISWIIDMEINDKVYFQNEQTNIMLSERYKNWTNSNKERGRLPDYFSSPGIEWQTIWQRDATSESYIAVLGLQDDRESLPSVSFYCDDKNGKYVAKVINADSLLKGRVLQYLRDKIERESEFSPLNYRYFEGRIRIDPI